MEIKYVGCYGEVEIDGYGIVKNGGVIDVPKRMAEGLIVGGEFKIEGGLKIEKEKKEKTKEEKAEKKIIDIKEKEVI